MDIHDLQKKKIDELQKLLMEQKAALQELRFKSASGQLKEVRQIREARKSIARIKTVLTQKQQESNATA